MHLRDPSMPLCLGVAVLAAGASRRMGCPKLLLPWAGTSVLGHLVNLWTAAGAHQVAVVVAPDRPDLDRELDRLDVAKGNRIINPSPELGMFSSIQCAARWDGWDGSINRWAITLGDQPHLRRETLRTLVEFAAQRSDSICQPSRGGRARHPVLLPKDIFQELAVARAPNLKEFLEGWRRRSTRCEIEDVGLDLDMDTPEDYERLLSLGASET